MKRRFKEIGALFLAVSVLFGIPLDSLAYVPSQNGLEQYALGSWSVDNIQSGDVDNRNSGSIKADDFDELFHLYSVPGWGAIVGQDATPATDYRLEFRSSTGTGGLGITIDSAWLQLYSEERVLMVWNPVLDYEVNGWQEFIIRAERYGEQIVDYYEDGSFLGQYSIPVFSWSGPAPLAPVPYLTLREGDLDVPHHEQFYFDEVMCHVVPIPSGVWLFSSGLVGFLGFGKRFGKR